MSAGLCSVCGESYALASGVGCPACLGWEHEDEAEMPGKAAAAMVREKKDICKRDPRARTNRTMINQGMTEWGRITEGLVNALNTLHFGPPVRYVYNPLIYAREPHDLYLKRYGAPPREILLLGMNPGPWGMAQTGVPFGEVGLVRDWLGIEGPVEKPVKEHPKRRVAGFDCRRSEVSGSRLWGWARNRFVLPERFFSRFFVVNYCPLLFVEESGRNRTPNNLPAAERLRLFEPCDEALRRTVILMTPALVLGVGKFAAERARAALADMDVRVGSVSHPSPANPKANRGWERLIEEELAKQGVDL